MLACNQKEYSASVIGNDAPWRRVATFDSFDEMQEYVSLVYSDPTGEAFRQKFKYRNYVEARKVAENLCSIPLPRVKEGVILDNVNIFYTEYPIKGKEGYEGETYELNIIYTVNGVRYRFLTSFEDEDLIVYESNWIFENQTIGTAEIDLYEQGEYLYGGFRINNNLIRVVVHTTRVGNVDFDNFELVKIQQDTSSE